MTKILRTTLPAFVAALFIAAFATSCNDDNNGGGGLPDNTLTDIVTLASAGENGFTVTLREKDDSPLVTLTFSDQRINTEIVKVGQRFLLNYRPDSGIAYKSGPAQAYGYRSIQNSDIEQGSDLTTSHWATYPVDLNMIWRTGEFINMMAFCDYANAPSKYDLVVDEDTLDDDIPVAYLLYAPDKGVDGGTKAWYSSFNISKVWNLDTCKGIRIVVVTNSGTRRYLFDKNSDETIRPQD